MTNANTPDEAAPDRIEAERADAPRENTSLSFELPVLSAAALIERADLERLIPLVRIRLGFPRDVFALAAWPLIAGFAEFVQLLPAPASRRYSVPGGLLSRGLVTALRALDYRRGQILPRGAPPEIIGEHAHRWTYAVFAAALLRGLDKTCMSARVWLERGDGSVALWDPVEGPMASGGAVRYRVEALSPVTQLAASESTLAIRLFERCVPDAIRAWLHEDARLLPELSAVLSGKADPADAIAELVARAATGVWVPTIVPPTVRVEPEPNVPEAAAAGDLESVASIAIETESLEAMRPEGSELALRFMRWLRQGITSGALAVNVPGALLHGVDEGLLLLSPKIFRLFAKQVGDRGDLASPQGTPPVEFAKRSQREVLRAGWHLRAEGGVNMLGYEWTHGDGTRSRLHGIVIRAPERFLERAPPGNPALVRIVDGAAAAD